MSFKQQQHRGDKAHSRLNISSRGCVVPFPVYHADLFITSHLVIPISAHQDTVGPMARSLTDAAIVMSVIAGTDDNDNYTLAQPSRIPDYMEALNQNALRGKRIGVPRRAFCNESDIDEAVNAAFNNALDVIRGLGATVIDPADLPSADEIALSTNETVVTDVDFKVCRPAGLCLLHMT